MKLIVAGSRDYLDENIINSCLVKFVLKYSDLEIVSGLAKGPDTIGLKFAKSRNIKYKEFPANWNELGKRAGIVRNEQMGDYSDGLLAFWDMKSNGTKHMINYMKKLNKKYWVINLNGEIVDHYKK